jgi:hypothetical protein
MTDEERRFRYGSPLDVRELAGLLRGDNPLEIDHFVNDNVLDLQDARRFIATMLKYMVARGV